MECSCTIDAEYDEGPDCYQEAMRKTRKTHKCCECGEVIQIGEKYESISGIWDGDPHTYKTCMDCKSLRGVFFKNWCFEMIWDDFKEEFSGAVVPESCISELTPAAREKVCQWIEDQWEREE